MRRSSAAMTFVVAASALTVAWRYADLEAAALNAPIAIEGLPVSPTTPGEGSATSSATNSPVATPTASTPEASGSGAATASPSSSATASAAPSSSAKPTQSSAAPAPAPTEVTKSSDTINYKYGSIAMSVTMLDNKIVAASITKGTTDFNDSYFDQWCQTLVAGGKYGNTSGATYSFEAFKAAATSAFGKF